MSAISIPKEHTKTLCLVKMLSIVEKPFHHVFSGRGGVRIKHEVLNK